MEENVGKNDKSIKNKDALILKIEYNLSKLKRLMENKMIGLDTLASLVMKMYRVLFDDSPDGLKKSALANEPR